MLGCRTAFGLIVVGFLFSLVATIVAMCCYVPGPNAPGNAAMRHYEPMPKAAADHGGGGLQDPLAVKQLAQRHALEMQQLVQRQALESEAAQSLSDSGNRRSKGAEAAAEEAPPPWAANLQADLVAVSVV